MSLVRNFIRVSNKQRKDEERKKREKQEIGISSIREIVERHGGSVSVYPMEHLFRVGITLPMK